MASISERLDELTRRSAVDLLKNVTISLRDIAGLTPTIVIGIGRVGHVVLDDLREYARDYATFLRENYAAAHGRTAFVTTDLVADAVEQPLSLLSLPYLDGTADPTTRALATEEVLLPQVELPSIGADLLSAHPDLVSWVHPQLREELRPSPNAALIQRAIEARLRLYFSRGELTQGLREAFARALVLRSDLAHAGLTQGLDVQARLKVLVVSDLADPCVAVLPDIVVMAYTLARESLYDARIGVVLVDGADKETALDVAFRDGARHLGVAAANTITKGYAEYRSNALVEPMIEAGMPLTSPVGAVYVLGRSVRGREMEPAECRRMASLLLFRAYYDNARMPIWSDRIQNGGVISGFGTAAVIFPWRYIKSFAVHLALASVYKLFEGSEPIEDAVVQQQSVPDVPSDFTGADSSAVVEDLLKRCLLTPRRGNSREILLRAFVTKVSDTISALEARKKSLDKKLEDLKAQREEKRSFYKKIGVLGLAALAPVGGAVAGLIASPASLVDYLSLPAIIAIGTGIGTLLGGGFLYWCVSVLGARACAKIDEEIDSARRQRDAAQNTAQALERLKSDAQRIRAELCSALHDDLAKLGTVTVPIDERQVFPTSLYLMVDQLCPVSENASTIARHLAGAEWMSGVRAAAREKYERLIHGEGTKSLIGGLLAGRGDLDELRVDFTMNLAADLAHLVDIQAKIGEGVITRAAGAARSDAKAAEWRQVLATWQRLSHPTLPINKLGDAQISCFAFVGEHGDEAEKALPGVLHRARVVTGRDLRHITRMEFVHGIHPSDLAPIYQNRARDLVERYVKWLDYDLKKVDEPIEVTLACQLLVGIRERLSGAEQLTVSDVYALDLPSSGLGPTASTSPMRVFVSGENPDLRPYARELDEVVAREAVGAKRRARPVAEYLREVRLVPKDADLWAIVVGAAEDDAFLLQSVESQRSALRELVGELLRGVEYIHPAETAHHDWKSRWVAEASARLQEELPLRVDATPVREESAAVAVAENASWRRVAEAKTEHYLEESINYFCLAKAALLACLTEQRFGLKAARTLVLSHEGATYRLGYSMNELVSRMRSDPGLMTTMGWISRSWSREPHVRIATKAAMSEINNQKQPFSYWLS